MTTSSQQLVQYEQPVLGLLEQLAIVASLRVTVINVDNVATK
jgi:hypothetical protein